jgi:hypothetical protein
MLLIIIIISLLFAYIIISIFPVILWLRYLKSSIFIADTVDLGMVTCFLFIFWVVLTMTFYLGIAFQKLLFLIGSVFEKFIGENNIWK